MFTFKNRVPAGFAMMVWQLGNVGGVQGCIDKCKAYGLDGIFLKGADGDSVWGSQFNASVVQQFHAAGLSVIGWHYVYGGPGNGAPSWSTISGEIAAMKAILAAGADGYMFDDEVELDGKPGAVVQYGQALRAAYPDASIGYNPYPYPSSSPTQPWFEFNNFCDYCMPQLYVGQDGFGTCAAAYSKMIADFATWGPQWAARAGGRAAQPLVIDWQAASWPNAVQPDSFITDAAQVSVGKVPLITYWDLDSLTGGEAAALIAASKIFHGGTLPPVGGPVAIVLEKNAAGTVTGAHDAADAALHVGEGIAQAIEAANLLAGNLSVPETYLAEGESVAVVRGGAFGGFTWSAAKGVRLIDNDDAVKAVDDLYHALKVAQAATAAPTYPNVQPQLDAAEAKIKAAQQALA